MTTRREFVKSGAAFAAASAALPAMAGRDKMIWGALLHVGVTMWNDSVLKQRDSASGAGLQLAPPPLQPNFNRGIWDRLTNRMAKVGMNMVVIDIGESLRFESHPELAAEGAFTPEQFRNELARLRGLGLEPIPKLNFSTAHDTWLCDYGRQVSTQIYYRVCRDLITEVCQVFDKPRFFHLGYDEETFGNQSAYQYVVVRQGEMWWHDFNFFVKTVEDQGARPWIWADYYWGHREEFLKRMPKKVLLSNWHYRDFRTTKWPERVRAYSELEKAFFDQIPCGSNWNNDVNFDQTVELCKREISPVRLKGFLMATWEHTDVPGNEKKLMKGIDIAAAVKNKYYP